jgi:transcriptional regulator with XRE-family HTH domain
MRQAKGARGGFDALALFEAIEAQRIQRGLSWRQVADEIWDQSAVLNRERQDHPISPSTLTGIARRGDCTCQHALFFLRWLGRTPESFLAPPLASRGAPLPAVGQDRRLRWNLAALYEALNTSRLDRKLTWGELADQLGCTANQLTGIRTARFAIGMRLAMQIVQWLDRPAATFIYAAKW